VKPDDTTGMPSNGCMGSWVLSSIVIARLP
jgi:hypothetical protein